MTEIERFELISEMPPDTVEELSVRMKAMEDRLAEILEVFKTIQAEVTPFLDSLSKSTLVRMLGIK